MGNLTDIAKEFYSVTDTMDVFAFQRYWDSNKIKALVQYDALRIVCLIYMISDDEDKKRILEGISYIFDYHEAKKGIEQFFNLCDYRYIPACIFKDFPYSIYLMYEHDRKYQEVEASYMFFEMLEVIVFAIIYPNNEAFVDERIILIRAYLDYIKNRLLASGIKEKHYVDIKGVRNINDLMDSFEKDHMWDSEKDSDIVFNLHSVVVNVVKSKELQALSESGKGEKIRYSFLAIQFEKAIEYVKRCFLQDYTYTYIRIANESFPFFHSLYDSLYGYSFSETGTFRVANYMSYINESNIDTLWLLIKKQRNYIDTLFSSECHLMKADISAKQDGFIIKKGKMLDCFEMAWDRLPLLQDFERYVIKYGNQRWNLFEVPNDSILSLKKLLKMISDISEVITSLDPVAKKGTSWDYVNDENYIYLWSSLRHNDNKMYHEDLYYWKHNVDDIESKLCYEQGKLLENVIWVGEQMRLIPEARIARCTHSVMEYAQLRYYLYWRTCFRTGKTLVNGNSCYYFLYTYELLADLGPYTFKQRLRQLELLYLAYSNLTHISWVGEYADDHGLLIENDIVRRKAYSQLPKSYSEEAVVSLKEGNYNHAFTYICKRSRWKLNSSFIKKTQLQDCIKDIVTTILPELQKMFDKEGISLADLLIGRENLAYKHRTLYNNSVWTSNISSMFRRNPKPTKERQNINNHIFIYTSIKDIVFEKEDCDNIQYCDPYLSEYILKYTEMMFREIMGYYSLAFPKKLGDIIDESEVNQIKCFAPNKDCKTLLSRYISLFNELEKIIVRAVYDYYLFHREVIDVKKQNVMTASLNIREGTQKKPISLQIIDFINSSTEDSDIERLLELYDKLSDSAKESQHKYYSGLIWDYWILHNCNYKYKLLSERILKNEWYIIEKKAIEKRQYEYAIPYFKSLHNIYTGELCKDIDAGVITDCICLSFLILDRWFSNWSIDSADVMLGEWNDYAWNIYSIEEKLNFTCKKDLAVNINTIEIYKYYSISNIATVSRHSYSMQSKNFIINILRRIDNELRKSIGCKKLLGVNKNIGQLANYSGFLEACTSIDYIICSIVRLVMNHNSRRQKQLEELEVTITTKKEREYYYVGEERGYRDIDDLIHGVVHNYYLND